MKNSVEIVRAEQLDIANSIKLKTSNDELALLIKIKDTDADFALFIMDNDEDTIRKAYKISNVYPTINIGIDAGQTEFSEEITFEFKASSTVHYKNIEKAADNLKNAARKMQLENIFKHIYWYRGTECSDCNDQYIIDSNEYVVTDGQIYVEQSQMSDVDTHVGVMFSTYVIIVELSKDDRKSLILSLYANEPDLDTSYDKIMKDVEKIKKTSQGMWFHFFEYLER